MRFDEPLANVNFDQFFDDEEPLKEAKFDVLETDSDLPRYEASPKGEFNFMSFLSFNE